MTNPIKFAASKTKGFLMSVFALSDESAAYYMSGGGRTDSGVVVTPSSALRTISVLGCVRLLSDTPAGLPHHVFREITDDVKERIPDHWLQALLDYPNPEMARKDFEGAMGVGLETWGQAFARKVLRPDGSTAALWPLNHGKTAVKRNGVNGDTYSGNGQCSNGDLFYRYTAGTSPVDYTAAEIFHLRGFTLDGINGESPISLARQGIGLTQATEGYGARYFGNDAKAQVVLEIPQKLTKEQRDQILEKWQEHKGGAAAGIGISEGGMKVHVLNIPPEDSQFLETRQLNDEQIARLFGVPPHMIGMIGKQTSLGAGVEQMSIGFVTYTLMPRLDAWEAAIKRSLLTEKDKQQRIFARHDVRGLLRGDHKSRAEALNVMRQNGALNADEWRAVEDMPPIGGEIGAAYLVNGAMVPVSMAGKQNQGAANAPNVD